MKHGGQLRSARDENEADALRNVRRQCSPSMYRLGPTKLNEDIVVPLTRSHELFQLTLQLKEDLGLPTPTYGHAADGNFHIHVMYDHDQPDERNRASEAIQQMMRRVVELGGVITGEHGIGLAKTEFLNIQHSDAELKAMKAIKSALDPNQILNPDKIWSSFRVWDHPKSSRHLPWEHH